MHLLHTNTNSQPVVEDTVLQVSFWFKLPVIRHLTNFSWSGRRHRPIALFTVTVNFFVLWSVASGVAYGRDDLPITAGNTPTTNVALGNHPFITLLCKFADISNEPRPPSYFTGLMSNVAPGLGHYWRTVTRNKLNLDGSTTISSWVSVPGNRDSYTKSTDGTLDTQKIFNDCTSTADPIVNFANYSGVSIVMNGTGTNWSASSYLSGANLTLDGKQGPWKAIFMPDEYFTQGGHSVFAHELGHAFGMAHSFDQSGEGSSWDVMSSPAPCFFTPAAEGPYGCQAQYPNAYNLGIRLPTFTAAEIFQPSGGMQTITLDALSDSSGNYLVAQIPYSDSTDSHFYTVEARRRTGYDIKLPGDGVILHRVVPNSNAPSQLLVADGSTTDALLKPGVKVDLPGANASVTLVGTTTHGYQVQIESLPIPPLAPSNLTITNPKDTQLTLNWTDNSNNESGFKIFQVVPNSNQVPTLVATVGANVTSYTTVNYTLSEMSDYYYKVQAFTSASTSDSSTVKGTTGLNSPTHFTAATPAINSGVINVLLDWTDNSAVEQGYYIYKKTSTDANFVQIATLGANAHSFTVDSLPEYQQVQFKIEAYLGQTRSVSSGVSTVTPLYPPANLNATKVSNTQIDVTWQDNSQREKFYLLERVEDGNYDSWTQVAQLGANTTSYSNMNLIDGPSYSYRLRAVSDEFGSNTYSTYSNLAEVQTNPNDPTALVATAISPIEINLTWQDNSLGETGFTIYRSSGGGSLAAYAQVGANVTSFSDIGLPSGQQYTYMILAVSKYGASGFSNLVDATTPANFDFTVTVGEGGVGTIGTLPDALSKATTGQTIKINVSSVNVPPAGLPPMAAGVVLVGSCGANGASTIINGGGANVVGLTLGGNNSIYGLKITGFLQPLVHHTGYHNKLRCVTAAK